MLTYTLIKRNFSFQKQNLFKYIYSERINKIEKLTKNFNYDNLIFIAQSRSSETDSSEIRDAVSFLMILKQTKEHQEK